MRCKSYKSVSSRLSSQAHQGLPSARLLKCTLERQQCLISTWYVAASEAGWKAPTGTTPRSATNMDYLDLFEYNDDYSNEKDIFTSPFIGSMTIPLLISFISLAICLICNSFVVAVVARRPQLQNFNYIGFACLAVVDTVWCIGDVIKNCLSVGYFTIPDLLCKTFASIPVFCNTFTALCISAIAVYNVKDTKAQLGRKSVAKSVGVVLALALLSLISCTFVLLNYIGITYRLVTYCTSHVNYRELMTHEGVQLIINCVVCSFIVIICLVVSKKRRSKEVVAVDENGVVVKERNRLDVRFESMVLMMWAVFVLLSLFNAASFWFFAFYRYNFYFVVQLVYIFNSFYKFFLYIGMDQHFRTQLKALLGSRKGSGNTPE